MELKENMAPTKELSIETMERVVKLIQDNRIWGKILVVPSQLNLKFNANMK